jgi:hypothetical protein
MTISDETLMAYADGELDELTRDAVESAMREDPQIEQRINQHRALRRRVQAAYSAELEQAVPERLLAAAKGAAGGQEKTVVDLQAARQTKERKALRLRPAWRGVGAIAASVIGAFGLGLFLWHRSQSPFAQSAGGVVAHGFLANALSRQLAADAPPGSSVQIGISYLAKSGDYCRTFVLSGGAATAGVACHHGDEWRVHILAPAPAANNGDYRTAGSAMSAALLKAVEADIVGEPLDQSGEKSAREAGWSETR